MSKSVVGYRSSLSLERIEGSGSVRGGVSILVLDCVRKLGLSLFPEAGEDSGNLGFTDSKLHSTSWEVSRTCHDTF